MTTATGNRVPAVNPWFVHTAVIEHVQPELTSVVTYRMRLLDDRFASDYRFRPGQFNMLYVPGCGETAISLSADPAQQAGQIVHTIRFVGRVTDAISKLEVGERIGVRGPFGSAWPLEDCAGRDVLIVAGGLGLAPLRPVIEALAARRDVGQVTLLYGSRTPDTLLYASQFAAWARQGIQLQVTVDRADPTWRGTVGVVPLLLDRLRPLAADRTMMFTCGPEVMMQYAIRSALARGISRQQIWLSLERNMQCAVGLCGHCQLGPAFVCRQGPVFRWDTMEPYLRVRDF